MTEFRTCYKDRDEMRAEKRQQTWRLEALNVTEDEISQKVSTGVGVRRDGVHKKMPNTERITVVPRNSTKDAGKSEKIDIII